jgi:hypothetical protein
MALLVLTTRMIVGAASLLAQDRYEAFSIDSVDWVGEKAAESGIAHIGLLAGRSRPTRDKIIRDAA